LATDFGTDANDDAKRRSQKLRARALALGDDDEDEEDEDENDARVDDTQHILKQGLLQSQEELQAYPYTYRGPNNT
jgi:hypothetical protein